MVVTRTHAHTTRDKGTKALTVPRPYGRRDKCTTAAADGTCLTAVRSIET